MNGSWVAGDAKVRRNRRPDERRRGGYGIYRWPGVILYIPIHPLGFPAARRIGSDEATNPEAGAQPLDECRGKAGIIG